MLWILVRAVPTNNLLHIYPTFSPNCSHGLPPKTKTTETPFFPVAYRQRNRLQPQHHQAIDQVAVRERLTRQCKWFWGALGRTDKNERFNGTLKRDCLNAECFHSTTHAQVAINVWLRQYHRVRPQNALKLRPPVPETLYDKSQFSGNRTGARHEVRICSSSRGWCVWVQIASSSSFLVKPYKPFVRKNFINFRATSLSKNNN